MAEIDGQFTRNSGNYGEIICATGMASHIMKLKRNSEATKPRISKSKIQGEITRINKIWIGPIGSKYRRHEAQDQDFKPQRLQDYGSDDLIWGEIHPQLADR